MLDYLEYGVIPGSHSWRACVASVTPDAARRLLDGNTGNRRLRRATVARYAATMAAGNWLPSTEAIVIGTSGRLLNGQHRLSAIIESGVTVELLIIAGVPDETFKVIDRGVPRSASDALKIDKRLAEAAVAIIRHAFGEKSVTDANIERMAETIEDQHNDLMNECKVNSKYFATAAMRGAACVRLLAGYDREYILTLYGDLTRGRFVSLPPVAQGLVGALLSGRIASGGGGTAQLDAFVRGWHLYDPSRRDNVKIQVRDHSSTVAEVAKVINSTGFWG